LTHFRSAWVPVLIGGLFFLGGCELSAPVADWERPGRPAAGGPPAPREACAQNDPLRRALFGDLHVHTSYSMDARAMGALNTPRDAYRYARGEEVSIGRDPGAGLRTSIDRPLDFAAVTDHAEWLGEVGICLDPTDSMYEDYRCRVFRGEEDSIIPRLLGGVGDFGRFFMLLSPFGRSGAICGSDGVKCRASLVSQWQATQAAAEEFYDRSAACEFTTLHGWEYSYSPGSTKLHRNVILRNELSPELPISSYEEPEAHGLWSELERLCNDTGTGCEALSIPHNPNLSNGRMFTPAYGDAPLEEQRRRAALRARIEPLVEMTQVKGDSECANGMYGILGGEDELCNHEKMRAFRQDEFLDCEMGTGSGALAGKGCQSRLDYVRYALVEGLREADRLGVNPYSFGFIGSTDTHTGIPGAVAEKGFVGASASADQTPADRFGDSGGRAIRNPGGLAGVWAEENSRDSIFDALKRRETFATSGVRIQPRFFGGWTYDDLLCDRVDLLEQAYANGVPMGSDLAAAPGQGKAPSFLVSALRDPGTEAVPGALLQRIQIINGWAGAGDVMHQQVYEVAGRATGASVDLATCQPRGTGYESLCEVWRDPDFDPAQAAVYYARVLENPTCRWSTWECNSLDAAERPAGCEVAQIPKTIQERAWTSPIWYTPPT
jgi:hypothetical protein